MKDYTQITTKYLKQQKKRTILAIIGIILSVALITGVGTLLQCFRTSTIDISKKMNGNYHIMYQGLTLKQYNKLSKHIKVKDIFKVQNEGFFINNANTSNKNLKFNLKSYDSKTFEYLSTELKEGRFPKNDNEIILDYWLTEKNKNIKLGNTISLSFLSKDLKSLKQTNNKITKQEHKYKIVGLINSDIILSERNIINVITKNTTPKKTQKNITAYVHMKSIKNIRKTSETIASNIDCDIKNISYNKELLIALGESSNGNLNLAERITYMIFAALIMISMIAVIYNVFHISVIERISQFGVIRCIGATPNQIKKIVLKEALILSVISIPIGAVSGIIAIKILLIIVASIDKLLNLPFVLSPQLILTSCILSFMTVILSAYAPAKRAGKISALEAVNNTLDIKIKHLKKFKKSHWFLKPLSIEGQIAWKSMKRNKKRFIVTVFSITISIILFITFTTFADLLISGLKTSDMYPDFVISKSEQKGYITQEEYKTIKQLPGIDVAYMKMIHSVNVTVPEKKYNKKVDSLLKEKNKRKDDKVILNGCTLISYGNDKNVVQSLKSLLKKGDVNIEKINKENGVLIVNSNVIYDTVNRKKVSLDITNLSIGDKIEFTFKDKSGNSITKSLNVVGILNTGINGEKFNFNNGINLITSEDVYEKIIGTKNVNEVILGLNKKANHDQLRKFAEDKDYSYSDLSIKMKEINNVKTVIYIFVYGFISIICLISSLNIINTINTNLLLRTKELTMLKAIGMSQFDIKKMITYESIYYGIIATFYGGIIGSLLSYLLNKSISYYQEMQYLIPYDKIMIAVISTILIALISAYIPLRRINKSIIMENLS